MNRIQVILLCTIFALTFGCEPSDETGSVGADTGTGGVGAEGGNQGAGGAGA